MLKRTKPPNGKRIKRDPLKPPPTGAFWEHGRTPIYNEEYHTKLVYRLALLNLSETEMLVPLDISIETFTDWKKTKSKFLRALLAGREKADAKVARALFRRAVGWGTYEEEVISRKVKVSNGDGTYSEKVETVTVPKRRRYPPDVAAIAMWLRNRHPAHWRVGDSLTDPGGASASVNVQVVDLSSLSIEELKLAQRLGALPQNVLPPAPTSPGAVDRTEG